ncbi:MAG: acyl-CoA dehydrogenase family protein [Acidimicrobiia bacterium]|nr:acyl-CoA dehydrogenase family protein [Acidimicrobiia bacterium]
MLDDVRLEVREWLRTNWDPERPLRAWRELLADSGWGCPTWPVDLYGRGLDATAARVVGEEMAAVGAVGPASGSAMRLAAPTILAHAPFQLQRRLLRPIITGEETWCQLFSEPGSGSDLAGLSTRAERDGDEWVVTGQKVWTTGARTAAFGMLLARTDWGVPKHRGISYFALPMAQPGIEVRPLRQMNGHASFNEVFLTEARVPHDHAVGAIGEGWAAALTTLAHERGLGQGAPRSTIPAGRTAREAAAEAEEYARTYVWYPQRAGRPDLAAPQAQAAGRADDPIVRQAVAHLESLERTARWTVRRAAESRANGRPPGPEGSVSKLAGSDIARTSGRLHAQLAGAHGMLSGSDSSLGGVIAEILVSTPAASIAGGTDEVQRNIVGERSLGLPKEPSADSGIPYRDVRRN